MAPEGAEERPDRRGRARSGGRLTADFLIAVGVQMGDGPVTAGALARATAQLLPVDGVGISTVVSELRLPLGSSTAAAETAEELQTTLGEGPCLAAAQARVPCRADLPELLARWPLYGEELTRQTPFRSVASIPLPTPDGQIFAALDLFAEDPRLSRQVDLEEIATQIGPTMGVLLDVSLRPVQDAAVGEVVPEWYEDATARRFDVWVAIGIVMARHHKPAVDALSMLRGYAYSNDRSLDDIAEDVVLDRLQLS